jgi:hypothetical protein
MLKWISVEIVAFVFGFVVHLMTYFLLKNIMSAIVFDLH